ncbi:DNA (cytosine-5)-methyltransferase DRM1 [Platanthera guangdongensis]|uniref:DNA (Cytosine-5)-methyltransferase DRM1 n=1 Tax=Platanthera guangdongensis TaxID=2320717 RepID=A0ABR2N1W4_9ASPA
MVKAEDCTDSEGFHSAGTGVNSAIGVGSSSFIPCSAPFVVKEESFPSSSSSHFKSYLVGMGFSPILVDKVIEENGEDDVNVLLEALLAHSGQQKSCRASVTLSNYSSPKKEENQQHFEFTTDNKKDEKDVDAASLVDMEKKSYLLMMDFTEEEIELAVTRLGESSSLGELVDFIIASQSAGAYGDKEMLGSINGGNENVATTTEALFGTMDKTLSLLRMGFTENEISSAIAKFGSDAPLDELADSILTSRLAFQVKEEDFSDSGIYFSPQEENEFEQLGSAKAENPAEFLHASKPWLKHASHSKSPFDDFEDKTVLKKAKFTYADDKRTSFPSQWQHSGSFECPSTYDTFIKKEIPDHVPRNPSGNNHDIDQNSPFFFYGNVADVSQDTWQKLSQFLHGTKPEFANTQFFSAFIRKEGYLHNLPTVGRYHISPKSAMTIEEALPHTKKWWPSWDTRKQLSCINSETAGVAQLCDRLGRMVEASRGMLSKEQQMDILHHCKAMNLIWIGPSKLCPIDPENLEQILGYPKHHTDLWGLELPSRLTALKYSFQTDTIGHLLSVLKSIYPDGLRLLSICSGIGGGEVALHRLGIHLRCVVSVETSESNRRIFKHWWDHTKQAGELRQISGVEKLTIRLIEGLVREFGGFDLIIANNPGYLGSSGSVKDSLAGMDLNHFYEFARVLHRMRSVMRKNSSSAGRRN